MCLFLQTMNESQKHLLSKIWQDNFDTHDNGIINCQEFSAAIYKLSNVRSHNMHNSTTVEIQELFHAITDNNSNSFIDRNDFIRFVDKQQKQQSLQTTTNSIKMLINTLYENFPELDLKIDIITAAAKDMKKELEDIFNNRLFTEENEKCVTPDLWISKITALPNILSFVTKENIALFFHGILDEKFQASCTVDEFVHGMMSDIAHTDMKDVQTVLKKILLKPIVSQPKLENSTNDGQQKLQQSIISDMNDIRSQLQSQIENNNINIELGQMLDCNSNASSIVHQMNVLRTQIKSNPILLNTDDGNGQITEEEHFESNEVNEHDGKIMKIGIECGTQCNDSSIISDIEIKVESVENCIGKKQDAEQEMDGMEEEILIMIMEEIYIKKKENQELFCILYAMEWGVFEVLDWLMKIGFQKYFFQFFNLKINGKMLCKLSDEQLRNKFNVNVDRDRELILNQIAIINHVIQNVGSSQLEKKEVKDEKIEVICDSKQGKFYQRKYNNLVMELKQLKMIEKMYKSRRRETEAKLKDLEYNLYFGSLSGDFLMKKFNVVQMFDMQRAFSKSLLTIQYTIERKVKQNMK